MTNYDKALEINEFISRCKRSMQLALARSEFPLLELADKRHSRGEAVSYLKLYSAGFLTESIREVNMIEVDNSFYCENMDYDVLPPNCSHDANRIKISEENYRRADYARRINISRAVSSLMLKIMQLDSASDIKNSVDILRGALSYPGDRPQSNKFSALSCSAISFGSEIFEQRLWNVVCNLAAFCAESIRLATETSVLTELHGAISGDSADGGSILLSLRDDLLNSLHSVKDELAIGVTLKTIDGLRGSPLSPLWLRMASAFVLTIGSLVPLMLETLTEPLVHTTTKLVLKPLVVSAASAKPKKPKGSKKSTEAPEPPGSRTIGIIIQELAKEVNILLDDVLLSLQSAKQSLDENSFNHFIEHWLPACGGAAAVDPGIGAIIDLFNSDINVPQELAESSSVSSIQAEVNSLWRRAKASVITDAARSQYSSCNRLFETLEKKMNHFRTVFPLKK